MEDHSLPGVNCGSPRIRSAGKRAALLSAAKPLLWLASIVLLGLSQSHAASIHISEIDVDQTGTDTLEFVELFDGGIGGTSLNQYSLVFYNGSSDSAYRVIDLSPYQTNATGVFLLGSAALGIADLSWADLGLSGTNRIQNGADAIALYQSDTLLASGAPVALNGLVDAVVYGTSDADDFGLLALLGTGPQAVQVDENGGGMSASVSITRTGSALLDGRAFELAIPTPGTSMTTSAVPIPAAGWLLISGLVGMSGLARRRRTTRS